MLCDHNLWRFFWNRHFHNCQQNHYPHILHPPPNLYHQAKVSLSKITTKRRPSVGKQQVENLAQILKSFLYFLIVLLFFLYMWYVCYSLYNYNYVYIVYTVYTVYTVSNVKTVCTVYCLYCLHCLHCLHELHHSHYWGSLSNTTKQIFSVLKEG